MSDFQDAQKTEIEIDIARMNQGKSKRLLENLIRSPAGVPYKKSMYGKQPDGVKDLLKRTGHETAATYIHKKRDKIVLDEKFRLIKKNNPA